MIDNKNNNQNKKCNIFVMEPPISDEDITALFNGIVNIMRRKIELESRAEIINSNLNLTKIKKELESKIAECNRLKNEIIYLKSKIKE